MANKFYYHKKKNNEANNADTAQNAVDNAVKYSVEQLSLTLEQLGIGDANAELLTKYRINTAADLVRRTDKDMYKVQGLNKKILLEISKALAGHGMTLKVETPQSPKPANPAQKQAANPPVNRPAQNLNRDNGARVEAQNGDAERRSKFGVLRRDTLDVEDRQRDRTGAQRRNDRPRQDQRQDNQNGRTNARTVVKEVPKPERLTEPLPLEQWRKVMKGGKWGFSDGFKITVPTMYDEVYCFKDGLASVELEEKCGYIDSANNIVIPFDYDTAMSFSEGMASVCRGDKCGYINKNNEVVIPFEYDAATAFEGGEAKIKKDSKWGSITPDGKITWI